MKTGSAVAAAVIAAAAAVLPLRADGATAQGGVLVLSARPGLTQGSMPSGLYFAGRDGSVGMRVESSLRPLAVARGGAVAAVRTPGGPAAPLVLVDGARTTELPGSSGAACAAFSDDGRRLLYLTGRRSS